MPKRWCVLVVYPNGQLALLRHGGAGRPNAAPVLLDKKTAGINADTFRDNLGDEITAAVAVRYPLVIR